jgi:hypothetical protein
MKFISTFLLFTILVSYQNCAPFHSAQSENSIASVTAFSLSCSSSDPRAPASDELKTLNPFEVENTLTDLFEPYLDSSQKTGFLSSIRTFIQALPKNSATTGMDLAIHDVTAIHVDKQFLLAEAVGAYIASQPTVLNKILGTCSATPTTEACRRSFIQNFGLRAFRRPLDTESVNFYLQTMQSHTDSYRNVIAAFLSSPFFYYHMEFGPADVNQSSGVVPLDAYERINRLSYFLLQSMPDNDLFAAAESGKIMTAEGYLEQVNRLLATQKVRNRFTRFFANQWLRLDQTPNLRTDLRSVQTRLAEISNPQPDALKQSLIDEVYDYFDYLIWEQKAGFEELMTSSLVFPRTPALANIYGSSQWDGKYDLTSLVSASPNERAGVLTRAQFLYSGSNGTRPIMRGVHVYRDFFCKDLNLPPDNSTPQGVVLTPDMKDLEVVRASTEVAGTSCVGCHKGIINPIASAFDSFDSFGKFRTSERVFHPEKSAMEGQVLAIKPVQSRVSMDIRPFVTSEVENAVDLSRKLASNANAKACFTSKLWNFAMKDNLPVEENPCAIQSVFSSLSYTNGSIIDAVKTIATQPEFTKRRIK